MQLPDDIKSSILTKMTEGPLKERRRVLNAAKLRNCEGVCEEIWCYFDSSSNSQWTLKLSRRASTANEQVSTELTLARTVPRTAIVRETSEVLEMAQRKARHVTVARRTAKARGPPRHHSRTKKPKNVVITFAALSKLQGTAGAIRLRNWQEDVEIVMYWPPKPKDAASRATCAETVRSLAEWQRKTLQNTPKRSTP